MEDYTIRVLSTKSFNKIVTTCTLLQGGLPFSISLVENQEDLDSIGLVGINNKVIVSSSSLVSLKAYFKESPVLSALCFKDGVSSLSDILNFRVTNDSTSSLVRKHSSNFTSAWDYINDSAVKDELKHVALTSFNLVNPITKELDINKDDYYTHLIPFAVLTGVVPPQVDEDNNVYFNPKGIVSRAEFIDMLYALEFGATCTPVGKKSIDALVREDDFFSVGYNNLVKGYSSPLYRLYTRVELMSAMTRADLAYMLVMCWNHFTEGNPLVGGHHRLGLRVDWDNAKAYMSKFTDISNLQLACLESKESGLELYISKYKTDKNITAYIESIKSGKELLPLPWFCCLAELDAYGIFKFNGVLEPLSEVTRGEVTYVLTQLARLFLRG